MALNVYSAERLGRANVLAGTAADAARQVDSWKQWAVGVLVIGRHHHNGPRRTVTGTVATRHALCKYDTVLLGPYRVAYLYGRLVFGLDGLDGARRADLATTMALWSAVAPLIR